MTICQKCGHDPDAVVTHQYTFVVGREPPSLNDRLVNTGPRARLYRKERDAWMWHFREARLKLGIPFARTDFLAMPGSVPRSITHGRRRVTLTRVFGARQRERDFDNLAGGMKACVDALVLEKLIAGDRTADAEIYYAQKRGDRAGLHVTIEVLA